MKTIRYIIFSLMAVYGPLLFAGESPAPVNINTADAATLSAALIGVGPSKARAIVAYRESYGSFKALEELTAVKGIGESLVEKNRSQILLE